MGMEWFKTWNGAHSDPLWLAVADLGESTPAIAAQTFFSLVEYGNERADRGSIAGYERRLPVIASFNRVPLAEIQRVVAALIELGKIVGDRIAAFARRQAVPALRVVESSPPAPRETILGETSAARRMRALRDERRRQGELLLPTTGGKTCGQDCGKPSAPVNNESEHGGEQVSVKNPQPIDVRANIAATEEEKSRISLSRKNDAGPLRRFAAFGEAGEQAIRDRKRALLLDKLVRFSHSRFGGAALEAALMGLAGCDERHDAQWWFNRLDRQMRAEGWDDRKQAA